VRGIVFWETLRQKPTRPYSGRPWAKVLSHATRCTHIRGCPPPRFQHCHHHSATFALSCTLYTALLYVLYFQHEQATGLP
jgi:hypothetical protein